MRSPPRPSRRGHACRIILLFHGRSLASLIRPISPVGQLAPTNYVMQSNGVILILTGVGPGLALAREAGVSAFLPVVVIVFVCQNVLSHFWLKAFALGPLELLWCTLTYGEAPKLRRADASAAACATQPLVLVLNGNIAVLSSRVEVGKRIQKIDIGQIRMPPVSPHSMAES